ALKRNRLQRRELIKLAAAAAWPLPVPARAQQREAWRRIGVLMSAVADSPEGSSRVGAFSQGLAEAGWTIGRNVRVEYRWAAGNPDAYRRYAEELVALAPDLIVGSSSLSVAALQQASRVVPIVFVLVADPVGAGFVGSLARPG